MEHREQEESKRSIMRGKYRSIGKDERMRFQLSSYKVTITLHGAIAESLSVQ